MAERQKIRGAVIDTHKTPSGDSQKRRISLFRYNLGITINMESKKL
jgi:hypothetical protein